MENKVSRSNGAEIIALLYFILAAVVDNQYLALFLSVMGVVNIFESIYWGFKFKNT